MKWQPKLLRWRKVHDHKQFVVSVKQLREYFKTDIPAKQEGSRVWANRWFQEARTKHDAERFVQPRPALPGENLAVIALGKPPGSLLDDKDVRDILDTEEEFTRLLRENPDAAEAPLAQHMEAIFVLLRRLFVPYAQGETEALSAEARERPEVRQLTSVLQDASVVTHSEQSLQYWCEKFLEKKRTELRSKDSQGNYGLSLRAFVEHVGPGFDAGRIDAKLLHGFNAVCKAKVILPAGDPNRRSPKTARERIRVVREFTRWLTDMGVIEKELRYERISFPRKPKAPAHMTVEEIRLALALANERTKLFCLLSLNCTYTSVDIANLREHEIDWDNGTIAHPRCKAEGYPDESRVVARHQLWPETFRLLKKFRSGDKNHVLLSERKTPLWRPGRHDMIYAAFKNLRNDMREKAGYEDFSKPFKSFKATAAHLVIGHTGNDSLGSFFCQHTSKVIVLRNYAAMNALQDKLFEAEDWLGRHLGLLPPTPTPATE
jgi:hypothetical protein